MRSFPLCLLALLGATARADTVAFWLFDEQVGVYPSSVLGDAGPSSHFLILGRGAEIAGGKFGHGLRVIPPAPLAMRDRGSGAASDAELIERPLLDLVDATDGPLPEWMAAWARARVPHGGLMAERLHALGLRHP